MMMMMIIIMFIKLSLKFIQLVNQFKSPNLQERIIKKLKKKPLIIPPCYLPESDRLGMTQLNGAVSATSLNKSHKTQLIFLNNKKTH